MSDKREVRADEALRVYRSGSNVVLTVRGIENEVEMTLHPDTAAWLASRLVTESRLPLSLRWWRR